MWLSDEQRADDNGWVLVPIHIAQVGALSFTFALFKLIAPAAVCEWCSGAANSSVARLSVTDVV